MSTLTLTLEDGNLIAIDPITHTPRTISIDIDGLKVLKRMLQISDDSLITDFLSQRQQEQARMKELRSQSQMLELEELF